MPEENPERPELRYFPREGNEKNSTERPPLVGRAEKVEKGWEEILKKMPELVSKTRELMKETNKTANEASFEIVLNSKLPSQTHNAAQIQALILQEIAFEKSETKNQQETPTENADKSL